MMRSVILCLALLTGGAAPAAARDGSADDLAAERYLEIDRLVANLDMAAHFVEGGKRILYASGAAGHRILKLADPARGTIIDLIGERELVRAISAARGAGIKLGDIAFADIEWDAAARRLTGKIGEARWSHDLTAGATKVDAAAEKPPGARSPDGRFLIIANGDNLAVVEAATGRKVALTRDGTPEQPYGRRVAMLSEIMEAGDQPPVLPIHAIWSPDSRWIATYRLDTRGVEPLSLTQASPAGRLYPQSYRYIYPTAGAVRVPTQTPIAIDVAASFRKESPVVTALSVPAQAMLFPSEPDLSWDDRDIRYLWTERGYAQLVDFAIDPVTGDARAVARERVNPVVTVTATQVRRAPAMGGDLIISERSGWAQLYFVSVGEPDGGIPLTLGTWEVASIERITGDAGILITGIGREAGIHPRWRMLYRITPGQQPQRLTPEPLDHDVTVAPDGLFFIDRMSSPTTPTRTLVRRTADGTVALELGRADPAALAATGFTPPEPFATTVDGVRLYGMIYRPRSFDPGESYPVLDNVYTGPTTSMVPVTYRDTVRNTANSVAQLGIVVVQIDGRGTSNRGQAFRLPAWRNLGEVGIDDHIAVLHAMAARYSYLDLDRLGAYGFSAGGYDAARFLLRRPDVFKVALAGAGNHDLRLDKAWWPEVSMGLADDATWERNSNIPIAGQLKGKLMLVHGEIDDNVPIAATYRLAKALTLKDKPFELVVLPDTRHRVYQAFFWQKARDFFRRTLLAPSPSSSLAHRGGKAAP